MCISNFTCFDVYVYNCIFTAVYCNFMILLLLLLFIKPLAATQAENVECVASNILALSLQGATKTAN